MAERAPLLESWYRDRLPEASIDISSSGVEAYSFAELRELVGIEHDELDAVRLDDSVSYGAPKLRAAVAERYAGGSSSHVMATHGSSEAIALILSTVLEPGARVLVVDPVYHALRTHAQLRGCDVVRVPTSAFTEARLAKLVSPGVDAVVVNFPHNPTGAVLSPVRVQELTAACDAVGAYLLWDGAMEELPMRGRCQRELPALGPRVIRFGTLSKAFGLPGLRVGWCIAEPEVLERTLALRDRTTLFLSPLVELVAARSIAVADRLIEPRLDRARANLDILDTWIAAHAHAVRWQRPLGGVCGLLEVRGVADTEPWCRALLREEGVLLVPGAAFEAPAHVRIGYGGSTPQLEEALRRLSAFLDRLSDSA